MPSANNVGTLYNKVGIARSAETLFTSETSPSYCKLITINLALHLLYSVLLYSALEI